MKTLWVVVLTVGLAACGGKNGNKDLDQLKSWADEMCACKDQGCAAKVTEKMTKASQEDKRTMEERKMSEDDMKTFSAESKRLTECAMKAKAAASELTRRAVSSAGTGSGGACRATRG